MSEVKKNAIKDIDNLKMVTEYKTYESSLSKDTYFNFYNFIYEFYKNGEDRINYYVDTKFRGITGFNLLSEEDQDKIKKPIKDNLLKLLVKRNKNINKDTAYKKEIAIFNNIIKALKKK